MIGLKTAAVSAALGVSGYSGTALVLNPAAGEDVRRVETAALALQAGLSPEAAVMATAIAEGESHHRDAAEGDTTITDDTWGPSLGRWQIRCYWSQVGTGQTRDCTRLNDAVFNARSMVEVSGGGENWRPWSVWLSGEYERYLPDARAAVAAASGKTVIGGEVVGGPAPVAGPSVERTPGRLGKNVWRLLMNGWAALGGSKNPEVQDRWQELDRELFGVPAPTSSQPGTLP